MGKLFIYLQYMIPHHALSRLVGFFAETKVVWLKNFCIRVFVKIYKIDMQDYAQKSTTDFASFNDFFTRELSAKSRAVSGDICSPVDGTISAAGKIDNGQIFQAKGKTYSLGKLLSSGDTDDFINGSFITIYLAPNNYHRVHFPVDATLLSSEYVPGKLFSVNNVSARHIPDLFAVNERLICDATTEHGHVSIVMIGAMIVAGIKTVWRASPYPFKESHAETFNTPQAYKQGDELGQFQLGSTVVLLFQGDVDWQVKSGDRIRFGEPLA
jgi:phosphatidylserine decarboxylase|tara:strand:- start:1348 stop:2154 length:807 start_codon:yes stop_codon:yes gene_type:complete